MNDTRNGSEWVTLSEAARLLKCSKRTIRRRVDNGELESRIDYQGKQPVRTIKRADILKAEGTVQRREPKTELVTRGGTYDNPELVIGQAKKFVTGLVKKLAYFIAAIAVVGGVTTYFLVIGQEKRIAEEIGSVRGGLVTGLSQAKEEFVTGLNHTREGLTAEIGTLRTAAEADTRERERQLKAQAEQIDRQREEIGELRAEIAGLIAGVDALREELTRPSPTPQEPDFSETVEGGEAGPENLRKLEVSPGENNGGGTEPPGR